MFKKSNNPSFTHLCRQNILALNLTEDDLSFIKKLSGYLPTLLPNQASTHSVYSKPPGLIVISFNCGKNSVLQTQHNLITNIILGVTLTHKETLKFYCPLSYILLIISFFLANQIYVDAEDGKFNLVDLFKKFC